MADFTPDEMMIIAASRALAGGKVYFAGVGPPSEACNLARMTRDPDIRLIYESGTIESKPRILPLSVGDGELCKTALTTVSVTEIFRYWLQGGRISTGILGAAQVDRFGNINTTAIGDYWSPKVRLPGGGGAPEIASSCEEFLIIAPQSRRGFVEKLDFLTTFGHGAGGRSRREEGFATRGPTALFTDLAIWQPDPATKELTVVSMHAGATRQKISETVGWEAKYAENVARTPSPSAAELGALRELRSRTEAWRRRQHDS